MLGRCVGALGQRPGWMTAGLGALLGLLLGCGGKDSSSDSSSGSTSSNTADSGNSASGTSTAATGSADSTGSGGATSGVVTASTTGGVSTAPATTATANTASSTGGITPCHIDDIGLCDGHPSGSQCIESGGGHCGCANSTECPEGFNCDISTYLCSDDPSIPESCALSQDELCAGDMRGFICIEENTGEYNHCGCTRDEHCPEGMACDTDPRECTTDAVPESCGLDSSDCVGNAQGQLCLEASPYNFCGCLSSEDCLAGTCDLSQRICL